MANKHAHRHRPTKPAKKGWTAKSTTSIPSSIQTALIEAMRREDVSSIEFDDFLWIMAQESGGIVDVKNSISSARGLFQLTMVQYSLNPNGEKSFGSAVEECQGGIRYILGRYHSAKQARAFWVKHHWY